jgi:hypothetical protein
MSTAQENYNAAYWGSKNPRVKSTYEKSLEYSKFNREAVMYDLATELEAEGLTSQADLIDYPIMVELKDPYIMMVEIRAPGGYTWTPSALQRPIGDIPGIAVPGVPPLPGQKMYDPAHPPDGSILVITDEADFAPFESASVT